MLKFNDAEMDRQAELYLDGPWRKRPGALAYLMAYLVVLTWRAALGRDPNPS